MSKQKSIIHYRTALTVFRKWLADGIITEVEFSKIDALIAQKYGLTSRSIYR